MSYVPLTRPIVIRESITASENPTSGDISLGEIAINSADGNMFIKRTNNSIVQINGGGGASAPADEVVLGTGSGITSNEDLRFDSTDGSFYLNAWNGLQLSGNGGWISLYGRGLDASNTSSFPGSAELVGGGRLNTTTSGNGGDVSIRGGATYTNVSGNGGEVVIRGGQVAGSGTGAGGVIRINTGGARVSGQGTGALYMVAGPDPFYSNPPVSARGSIFISTLTGGSSDCSIIISNTGDTIIGNGTNNAASLATTATAGFIYIPTISGTPTGTPSPGWSTTSAPMVVDPTGNKLWVYIGGAWKSTTLS